ncbi:hypothetical protein FRC12_005169 [Ceratobasidium sp. 428]|nr:hypothetical protein FRC12_005169 [Ceratobasidium sp. 428]
MSSLNKSLSGLQFNNSEPVPEPSNMGLDRDPGSGDNRQGHSPFAPVSVHNAPYTSHGAHRTSDVFHTRFLVLVGNPASSSPANHARAVLVHRGSAPSAMLQLFAKRCYAASKGLRLPFKFTSAGSFQYHLPVAESPTELIESKVPIQDDWFYVEGASVEVTEKFDAEDAN